MLNQEAEKLSIDVPFAEQDFIEDTVHRFWSSSEHCLETQDLSHWFGTDYWKHDNRLAKWAQGHVEMFFELCEMNHIPLWQVRSMLEWGPGGGGNAVAFSPYMDRVVGVDISSPNLEECIRQYAARNLFQKINFSPLLIDISAPESVPERLDERVQFFLSTAVYQHFPSRKYGVRVTKIANQVLLPNGLAIIQTRTSDVRTPQRDRTRDYVREFASFTCYSVEEFTDIASQCGFEVQKVVHDYPLRYVYFMLRKTRELNCLDSGSDTVPSQCE